MENTTEEFFKLMKETQNLSPLNFCPMKLYNS